MKKCALFITILSLGAYYSTQAMEEGQSEQLKKMQKEVEEQKEQVRANITKFVENQCQKENAREIVNTIHKITDNRKGTSHLEQHIKRHNRHVRCCFCPWFD